MKSLLKALDPDQKKLYDQLVKKIKNNDSKKNLLNDFLSEYHEESIVKNIVLTIGFRCEVKNTPGGLAQLAEQIAEKHIPILEIDQKVDSSEQKNIADIWLGFYPDSYHNPIEEIKNIKKFTDKLKTLDCIENIFQLNADLSK